MKVNVINEYRVEMELGEEELHEFDITYESLDYGDINTRRFLSELAANAKELGVEADMSGRVLIEAFRIRGGCRVCFTFLPPRGTDAPSVKQLVKKDMRCLCVMSDDAAALCRLSAVLPKDGVGSRLYRDKSVYYLFLFADPEALRRCGDTAAEFGVRFYGNAEARLASCEENCICLSQKDAVRRSAGT